MNRRTLLELALPSLSRSSDGESIPHAGDPSQSLRSLLAESDLNPYIPSDDNPWDYQKAAHLLRRCVIGPTHAEIQEAVATGLQATLDRLFQTFEPSTENVTGWLDGDVQTHPSSPDQPAAVAFVAEKLRRRDVLRKWWLQTIVESPLSVQERLTFFWHNHFVTEMAVVENAEFVLGYNQLVRLHALGNFKQFVRDVTTNMAMLIYLDGVKNFKTSTLSSINENYSRELLELFTIGVYDVEGKPNYTQKDVAEGARALTGWHFQESPRGDFWKRVPSLFVIERWDPTEKSFLGERGAFDAMDVVDLIFSQRPDQVARFICEKLYREFVYEVPDAAIVAGLAETFRAGEWEIAPVLRQLLGSRHFFDTMNIGGLVKSSHDLFLGAIRGLGVEVNSIPDFTPPSDAHPPLTYLAEQLLRIGHLPLYPPNVKGWPGGRSWVTSSTIPARLKFLSWLATGRITTWGGQRLYRFDPVELAQKFSRPDNPRILSADMALYFMGTRPTEEEEEYLYRILLDGGVDYEWDIEDPAQNPGGRIMKYLDALFQLPKLQLY